jgi:GNAT superfamily N-acetyltransferase
MARDVFVSYASKGKLIADAACASPESSPGGYQQEITLLGGSKAILRLIRSEDKNALRAFHSRLSQDTRFLRYQYSKGDLTQADLDNFCDVDYHNTLALVAEVEREGCNEIIGVGRYYRLAIPNFAEVAFVVQDDEQKKGIGTQLLKHLALIAWQQDIHYFVAELLRTNARMLSIFKKSDPKMEIVTEGGSTCTGHLSVSKVISRMS